MGHVLMTRRNPMYELTSSLCTVDQSQIKRDLKGIHICGCRWNERLKGNTDESTLLGYTGSHGELEHIQIETRLIGESFECVMVIITVSPVL